MVESHFREWQEASKRAQALVASMFEAQGAAHRILRDSVEAIERSLEQARVAQEQQVRLAATLQFPTFDVLGPSLTAAAAAAQGSIFRDLSETFEPLQRTLRELPPRTQEALLLLGAHGWYLDLEMPMPGLWVLRDALAEGNVTEAESVLCEHYECRLDGIEKSIVSRSPHRAHLIKAAFGAHRREEYGLSIPLLLAQVDGICKELTNEFLFMSRDKKPCVANYVEEMAANCFLAALLSPLAETLPISASRSDLMADAETLNRHAILHGQSLHYGNKTNGLKAISLINYVVHVLCSDLRKPTSSQPLD